jgi:hypothetical protein
MKFKFILLLVFCFPLFSLAQRIEVTKGPVVDPKQIRNDIGVSRAVVVSPLKDFSYSATLFFNPLTKRTYTGIGLKDEAFQFAVLEDYLKYQGLKKLTSETINEKVALNAFIFIEGKLYVLYSQKFSDRDEFSVYVNEVSEDMVVLGSPILVQNFKDLKKYGMNVYVSSSEDKKYILISRFHETKPKEKQRIECKVVSQLFSEVWYKLIETESMDKELLLRSANVDNAGNLYMLVDYLGGKENQPMVYSYQWGTKSLKLFNLGLDKGINYGTRLKLLNGEKPYIIGLNKNEKVISYFMNRVNVQSQTLENLGSNPMPEDFYETSQVRAFDTEDWEVTDMITLDNNSIVASIEALLVDPKYGVHHTYNTYVVSFKEDGTKNWTKTIQKKQVAMAGLDGHILIPAGNNALVIYNDNKENISKKPEDPKVEVFKSKDAMIVVQEIDPTGKVSKYPFTKDKDLDGYSLFFTGLGKIENGFYYSSCINVKGMLSVESRSLTFRIK